MSHNNVAQDALCDILSATGQVAQRERRALIARELRRIISCGPKLHESLPTPVYSGLLLPGARGRKSVKSHLTLDKETALCGLTLIDPAASLSFQADGCQRCRKAATARGLLLPWERPL